MRVRLLLLTVATALMAGSALADTSVTAYATYWDGDDSGRGAGLRLRKTVLAFAAVEGRAGYAEFTDSDTKVYPLEASIIGRLPFMISPYAGVGLGYYPVDSKIAGLDNCSGGFVQLGVEATFVWVGAMAEIRYYDMEEDYFDGTSACVGLLLKW